MDANLDFARLGHRSPHCFVFSLRYPACEANPTEMPVHSCRSEPEPCPAAYLCSGFAQLFFGNLPRIAMTNCQ